MSQAEDAADTPPDEELVATPADPELEEPVVLLDEGGESLEAFSAAATGLTSAVGLGLTSCAAGCFTRFLVPPPQVAVITARFRFVVGSGTNRYSGFAYLSGVYPGTSPRVTYPARIPVDTRQIWAYWWKDEVPAPRPVPAYYNYINVRC